MMNNELFRLMNKIEASVSRILGLEGKYYHYHEAEEMLLSLITYKRVCDNISDDHLEKEQSGSRTDSSLFDSISSLFKETWGWKYVFNSDNIAETLQDAIFGINTIAFEYLPYGDKLVPELHVKDKNAFNSLLKDCMNELSHYSFDTDTISDDDWGCLSNHLRKRIKK